MDEVDGKTKKKEDKDGDKEDDDDDAKDDKEDKKESKYILYFSKNIFDDVFFFRKEWDKGGRQWEKEGRWRWRRGWQWGGREKGSTWWQRSKEEKICHWTKRNPISSLQEQCKIKKKIDQRILLSCSSIFMYLANQPQGVHTTYLYGIV